MVFDGQGAAADDLDFGDNVATLHSLSGMTNIFEDGADQVALYRSQNTAVYLPLILSTGGGSPQAWATRLRSSSSGARLWHGARIPAADADGAVYCRGLG